MKTINPAALGSATQVPAGRTVCKQNQNLLSGALHSSRPELLSRGHKAYPCGSPEQQEEQGKPQWPQPQAKIQVTSLFVRRLKWSTGAEKGALTKTDDGHLTTTAVI